MVRAENHQFILRARAPLFFTPATQQQTHGVFPWENPLATCGFVHFVIPQERVEFVKVACGSGDAHTLAVSRDGRVWSCGDGDYGQLGRGKGDKISNISCF